MRRLQILGAILVVVFLVGCTVQQIQNTLDDYLETDELTTDQVVAGLKEALEKGAGSSTASASRTDGYLKNPKIRIPFPPDVQKVEDKLRDLGLGSEVDKFVTTLNRGAEEAAKEAKPIIVNAIKGMTVQDAWGILKGKDNAATEYLKAKTSNDLKTRFQPVIKRALDKTNATKYYSDLVNTYNKIPFVDKVNPDLDDYATERALEGLFKLVAEEEKNIRDNPVARTTEILKKVFSQQD
ncbi:MAG: DUF4197 domain-containing protein [Marinoscillum sp.]